MAQERLATVAQEHLATSSEPELLSGRYQLLKTIGEGNSAKVKLAKHLPTGAEVAVKIIKLKDFASHHRFLAREVRCMKVLQHPNIVQLYEVIETKDTTFIVMEYLPGGSMMDHLKSYGRIKEKEARRIFRQLTSAVYYCHQCGIAHRDIKPENILFDSRMNAKIGDFGFGTEFRDSKLATMCCSPSYAAPELFLGEDYEGPAVDVWSLGVTLFRMVAGRLPFKAQDCKKLGQQVIKGKYTVPYFFSFELEAFLKKMLRVKPEERRDLIDIMSDSWLNQDEEEDQMLYNEPPKENLDPWVKKEMKKLGFCYDDIQDALMNKTFNNVMAAYLILDAQKPKYHWRTIRVNPYSSTDQNPAPARELQSCSSSQQTEQHQDNYELGQEGKKSAAPAARQQLWTTTPSSSPESSPEPRAIRPWWRSPNPIAGLQSSTSENFLTANYGSSSSSSSYSRSGSSGVTCHRFQRLARRCCNCITKLWQRLSRKNKVNPL